MRRGYLYAALVAGVVGGLYVVRGCRDRAVDRQITSPVLAPNEMAKVVVDPARHTVTTSERGDGKRGNSGGVSTGHSDPYYRGPVSVTVDKAGVVRVASRSWGTTFCPLGGVGYFSRPAVLLGADLFYVRRVSFGPAALLLTTGEARVAVYAAYNFWSNTSVFVAIDHKKTVGGGIAVRF